MKRMGLLLATTVVALVVAVGATAGTSTYAGPKYWGAGQSAGSSFSGWFYNWFSKSGSGFDSTVTFIDNVSYSWHRTVRNTSKDQYTFGSNPPGRKWKGHCIAHTGYHHGSCWVAD